MGEYYDGTKLLSLLDLDGEVPEIYMATTNRTGGKTVYFSRLLINRFKKKGEKFAVLYRYKYELDSVADKFFKDVNGLFFPGDIMTSKARAKGVYHDIYLNDEHCGYALAINCSEQIKRNSHLLSSSSCSGVLSSGVQSASNASTRSDVAKRSAGSWHMQQRMTNASISASSS